MNPFFGVFLHWLGGLASGSFYVPYKGVKKWAWEVYWLVGGFFSWIIMPWLVASLMTTDLLGVLSHTPGRTLWWAYFFGAMWGLGGLTFGLTMRYLGMSLGMGVALGYCAAFGTLVPPIFLGQFGSILRTTPGLITLGGVGVCLLGIFIAALAGLTKEREMPEAEKKKAIAEFSFTKGILVATFSGIMSACFAFGLAAGDPIKILSLRSDYIHSSKADGTVVNDVAPVDEEAAAKLMESLKGTAFFKDAAKEVQEKPSLADVVEQVEKPVIVLPQIQGRINEMKTKLSSLQGDDAVKAAKDIAEQEKRAATISENAPEQAKLLAQSPNAVAGRLTAYTSELAKLAGKTNELQIIQGLKHLTVKEVAVATEIATGKLAKYHSKHQLWQGLPVLVVVLLGGFTTNFIWCVLLNIKNRTGYQYFCSKIRPEHLPNRQPAVADAANSNGGQVAVATLTATATATAVERAPMLPNYFFSALAGTTWYMQFFFYTMGETQMGKFSFASWTLHMASIIIFSTMWGWILHEWKGSSKKAHSLIATGIATLILSTIIIGVGTWLKGHLAGGH